MRRKVGAAAAALIALSAIGQPALAADPSKDAAARVRAAEARLEEASRRMSRILREMSTIEAGVDQAARQKASAYIRLERATKEENTARARLNERAREAYKRGFLQSGHLVLGAREPQHVKFFGRYLSQAMESDSRVVREMEAAAGRLEEERETAEGLRRELLTSHQRLDELRDLAIAELQREQRFVEDARRELSRIEEERRRAQAVAAKKPPSPQVQARRAARQIILDEKLAALLAWYAPGSGDEPFMPARLRGTGVRQTVTTSWYGPGFDGRRASSGATYHQDQLTAASLILPFGTLLKVSFRGKAAVVVITDRGPYVEGRALDLSKGAADALGLRGVKQVDIEVLVPVESAPAFP
ncbi:MAG TPA: RlpA-like double-psi beta-barrel domain-containing protein [Actinomycetota bacterium]|nr:RlpA-like double-psi beta-barrel domain-containing protein [Actinomycetota bacterium]